MNYLLTLFFSCGLTCGTPAKVTLATNYANSESLQGGWESVGIAGGQSDEGGPDL